MTEAEIRVTGFEDEGRPYLRNTGGGHKKLKKARKQILPLEPSEGNNPSETEFSPSETYFGLLTSRTITE